MNNRKLKKGECFLMEALLLEWGTEIILSFVIAYLTYQFKKSDKEKDQRMAHYQELLDNERDTKTKEMIDVKLDPIYKELEEIRKRVFDLQDYHMGDINAIRNAMDDREYAMRTEANERLKIIDDNLDLIISSYKYRLVELCKALEQQGFMYQYQYDHLSEFYHLYRKLGGNGQAQEYYDRVCDELKTRPNPDGYTLTM